MPEEEVTNAGAESAAWPRACSPQDAEVREPANGEVICGVRSYELDEKYERSRNTPDLNSFLSFISYHSPERRRHA
jgi:hypothetical protein